MEGVSLHLLKRIDVPKGDIYQALKSTDEGYMGFGEVYFSQIKEGEIKGWKRHNRMVINLVVIVGTIKFVVYDDRKNSENCGQFKEYVLSPEDNYQRLTVSPGLWVAFQGMGSGTSMLMNLIPEQHNPLEADNKAFSEIVYDFNIPMI